MHVKHLLLIMLIVSLPTITLAQTSTLISSVSNFGTYGNPDQIIPSGQWPGESGYNYIWEGRLWVGAIRDGDRRVTHADYGNYEWYPPGGPVNTEHHVVGSDVLADTTEYNDYEYYIPTHFPLGIRVNQTVEAFASRQGLDEAFLVKQTLYNDGSNFLDSVYIAWVFDCDVASGDVTQPHIDDWVSYQPERSMGYMWDGDDPSTPEDDTGDDGLSTGYIGIALLEAPLPLCSFQYWNWNEDPGNDDEKFQFMAGIHPASGGNPFRADPDSVFDYRILISTGPYTFSPGDMIFTAMTFAVGEGMEGLNDAVDEMIDYYTPVIPENPVLPLKFSVGNPYPNPFNPTTVLSYRLSVSSRINLSVYDISGRKVAMLIDGFQDAGTHQVMFDGSNLASGIYIYRLTAGEFTGTGKLVLLK